MGLVLTRVLLERECPQTSHPPMQKTSGNAVALRVDGSFPRMKSSIALAKRYLTAPKTVKKRTGESIDRPAQRSKGRSSAEKVKHSIELKVQ
mmetsp:Transcript_11666/g.28062  ORF Transcript_11666/g.28062 Transcript_11666/m.28062 type:complete len:92 (+) Transcript_11666:2975-3250(+)